MTEHQYRSDKPRGLCKFYVRRLVFGRVVDEECGLTEAQHAEAEVLAR